MRTSHKREADVLPRRAFSLLELLVVVSIIAILVSLLMPSLGKAKQRALRIYCVNNLKQIGTAYQVFSTDHGGKFPMQVPRGQGGTLELTALRRGPFVDSHRQLQVLSNEIQNPKVLICPTDRRVSTTNFPYLTVTNISYLVNSQAIPGDSDSVLSLDRNFILTQTNVSAFGGPPRIGTLIRWTAEMHGRMGNVLYSDIHVDLSKDHAVVKAAVPPTRNAGWTPSGPGPREQRNSQAGAPGDDGKENLERPPASGPFGEIVSASSGVSQVKVGDGSVATPERPVPAEPFNSGPAIQEAAGPLPSVLQDENSLRHRIIAFIAVAAYLVSLLMALIVLLAAYLRARHKAVAMASLPSLES